MAQQSFAVKQQPQELKRERRIAAAVLFIGFLGFLLALVFVYQLWSLRGAVSGTLPNKDRVVQFNPDANSEIGDRNKDNSKIVAALNEKVAKSSLRISMNTTPVFANGRAKGNLMIINKPNNWYDQQVEIYTKDTHQLIYSGGVKIGSKIEASTLAVDLPKGTYDCIAYFNAMNPVTGKYIAHQNADVLITVQS